VSDLPIVQKTYDLIKWYVPILNRLPRDRKFMQEEDTVLNLPVVHLEHVKRITQQAIDLFENEQEAQKWLSTPKISLNHQTPLSAMITSTGVKQVESMLYRAEYGIYG
jgi:putative toxin-antitoxin system antitoxin component (TIGR02293 family)